MIPIRDTVPRRYPPVAVWILIALNVLVFLFELALPDAELERVIYAFGVVPARATNPDWTVRAHDALTLVTSMFLHGGWLHLIGNMWSLWIFGASVEDRMGPRRFAILYFICGLIAGVTHVLTNAGSSVPTVGASGAIAGIMGAYLALYPRARVITVLPLPWLAFVQIPAVLYLGLWYLSQIAGGLEAKAGGENAEGIAFWAHVGGFGAGLVLHRLFLAPERRAPRRDELGLEGAWHRTWEEGP
jgi:membrane associated rhomboid family serine protease